MAEPCERKWSYELVMKVHLQVVVLLGVWVLAAAGSLIEVWIACNNLWVFILFMECFLMETLDSITHLKLPQRVVVKMK